MNKRKNTNWQEELYLLLERGCSDSDIEDFVTENPSVNAKKVWDFAYEYDAPERCKGCKHIQMASFEPCNRCSRRVLVEDYYESRK